MVRHDVEDLAKTMSLQRSDPSGVFFGCADFGIKLLVVGDGIAVEAAWSRLEVGRSVAMADAQVMQIERDSSGVGEGESCVKLETICRLRRAAFAHSLHGAV